MTTDIIRQIALTGCRRSEIIKLRWVEADMEASCLRLAESKEGASTRAIGLPVVEFLERRWMTKAGNYVFPGQGDDNAFGSFPNHWDKIFHDTTLADITPHVLRHSFASIANDLGFTEVTIAALVGHSKGSVTSKYIHTLDTALIMAGDRGRDLDRFAGHAPIIGALVSIANSTNGPDATLTGAEAANPGVSSVAI